MSWKYRTLFFFLFPLYIHTRMRWDSKNTKRTNDRLDGRTDVKKYFLMSGILKKKKIPRAPDLGASFFFFSFFFLWWKSLAVIMIRATPIILLTKRKKKGLKSICIWSIRPERERVCCCLSSFIFCCYYPMGGWVLGVETFSPRQYWIIRQGGITTTMEDLSTSPCCFSWRWLSNRYSSRLFLFLDEIEQLFKEWGGGEIEKQTEAFSFLPNEMLRLYRW